MKDKTKYYRITINGEIGVMSLTTDIVDDTVKKFGEQWKMEEIDFVLFTVLKNEIDLKK